MNYTRELDLKLRQLFLEAIDPKPRTTNPIDELGSFLVKKNAGKTSASQSRFKDWRR